MNNLPKKNVVIDTNVALVANRKAIHADEDCIDTCIQVIEGIRDRCCVVVDNQWAIMREYEGQLNSSGQPGVGDAFLKWLLTHLWKYPRSKSGGVLIPSRFGTMEKIIRMAIPKRGHSF